MSQPSGNASSKGQYGAMRKKIAQVAKKALHSAAKSSKVAASTTVKASKVQKAKPSSKLK